MSYHKRFLLFLHDENVADTMMREQIVIDKYDYNYLRDNFVGCTLAADIDKYYAAAAAEIDKIAKTAAGTEENSPHFGLGIVNTFLPAY